MCGVGDYVDQYGTGHDPSKSNIILRAPRVLKIARTLRLLRMLKIFKLMRNKSHL
jgi:hypothetical protein